MKISHTSFWCCHGNPLNGISAWLGGFYCLWIFMKATYGWKFFFFKQCSLLPTVFTTRVFSYTVKKKKVKKGKNNKTKYCSMKMFHNDGKSHTSLLFKICSVWSCWDTELWSSLLKPPAYINSCHLSICWTHPGVYVTPHCNKLKSLI